MLRNATSLTNGVKINHPRPYACHHEPEGPLVLQSLVLDLAIFDYSPAMLERAVEPFQPTT